MFTISGLNVYRENDGIKAAVGMVSKKETVRIDDRNVQDITYEFNLAKGEYEEKARVGRVDVLVLIPSESERIKSLEDAVTVLLGL